MHGPVGFSCGSIRLPRLLVPILAVLACASPVRAAIHCVTHSVELQQALTASAASPQDDEIRIREGIYTPQQSFEYVSQNPGWLFVSGGWQQAGDDNCATQSGRADTTLLDGAGQRQVFKLIYFNNPEPLPPTRPQFFIQNLTLANGVGRDETFERGGGLYALSSSNHHVSFWLDNLIVQNNSGYFAGGIHLSVSHGEIRLSNSLFVDNAAPTTAAGQAALHVNATDSVGTAIMIANSTFVGGTCAGQGTRGCGVHASLPEGIHLDVLNSLFRNNAISDLNLENGAAIGMGVGSVAFDSTLAQTISGNMVPIVERPLTGDPAFVDEAGGNFRLRDDSPFINAGLATFPGAPAADLDGNVRVRFDIMDPGPYENQTWDLLFADGFQ